MSLLQSTWEMAEGKPVLLGSRCSACGTVHFPARRVCPACGPGPAVKPMRLSRRGRLYAFTQLHQSKPSFPTPYYMGYVDLPEGVRVAARIACNGDSTLHAQDELELDTAAVALDSSGQPVVSYVFRPAAAAA